MKSGVNQRLWSDFVSMIRDAAATNYESYYTSLVHWIGKNKRYFTDEVLIRNFLDVLISLEPQQYIVDNPEFQLEYELDRFMNNKPDRIDTLAMLIGSRLLDMVSIRSDKNCSSCVYGDLRYFILEGKDKILLECNECTWIEHIDGTEYGGGVARMLPANKMDLYRHGIKMK